MPLSAHASTGIRARKAGVSFIPSPPSRPSTSAKSLFCCAPRLQMDIALAVVFISPPSFPARSSRCRRRDLLELDHHRDGLHDTLIIRRGGVGRGRSGRLTRLSSARFREMTTTQCSASVVVNHFELTLGFCSVEIRTKERSEAYPFTPFSRQRPTADRAR